MKMRSIYNILSYDLRFNMNVSLAKAHCELELATEFIFDKTVIKLSQQ